MKIKSVFISDTHIGNPMCQSEKLYDFLKSFENEDGSYSIENLFLVGDIIDITGMNHKVFWSFHRKIIKKLIRMADRGVKIFYIIGNHDYHLEKEFLQNEDDLNSMNNITFCRKYIYKNILLIHGDQFDGVIRAYPILYFFGDVGYHLLIKINHLQNCIRRLLRIKEWSFSLWVKNKVKRSIEFMNNFDESVARYARENSCHTVIYGHIHRSSDSMKNDVRVMNCGTWVEFCSYIVEYEDGILEAKFYE
jgi:UDP-2,3-diacylglucosamine pyrophosphatase LpxH